MATNNDGLLHTSRAKIDTMASAAFSADAAIQAEIKNIALALASGNMKAIHDATQKISAASTLAASSAKIVVDEVKEYMAFVPEPATPAPPAAKAGRSRAKAAAVQDTTPPPSATESEPPHD